MSDKVSIHSLAPEFMGRIFSFVSEHDLVLDVETLCRASLVCKRWIDEARILLWSSVHTLEE